MNAGSTLLLLLVPAGAGEPPPDTGTRKGPTIFASSALPARRPDPTRSTSLE